MDNRPIGMFDSGVGGLTVYKEIRKKFPNENIVYLGDTKSFPYGSKSKESIINLTKNGINYVEVAHIRPVRKGGQSIIGNLVVLCPNHHKEFDLGDLKIMEQNEKILIGVLNNKEFKIKF